jgi:hypothetical protein
MNINEELLYQFEKGLNPQNLKGSLIPATILGFGEISTIFQIADHTDLAYKRMPLFSDRISAETYTSKYLQYCRFLTEAGLKLPEHGTSIIQVPGRPVSVYIAQRQFPLARFSHKLIHTLDRKDIDPLLEHIVSETEKVWHFNHSRRPSIELALDGQVSNWVWLHGETGQQMIYIDTSTPLHRLEGQEQLDPELFLQSAPAFLRWIIRWLFLADVMNRYYDPRSVYIDLTANLYKEQRPDLVPATIHIINRYIADDLEPLSVREVLNYYKEDKIIWTLFLAFRRLDRWISTKLFRRRYKFILPGKIKR